MSLRTPARSISIRRSSRASTVSRDTPIPPRISPCCGSTASTRPPRWWISVRAPGGSLWPPRRTCAAWWPSMCPPRCCPRCGNASAEAGLRQRRVRAGRVPQLRTHRRARGRDLHPQRPAPVAGLLEGARAGADRRGTRPGGVLRLRDLIFDFQPAEAGAILDDWLDGAVADPERGYTREDFAEHLRAEFSTFRWLLEPMLAAAGLTIVTAAFEGSIYGAYTCVKA